MVEKLVLDTSVLIEYIVLRSKYRSKVAKLFDMALNGRVELYVNPITLSETLYVASKIYEAAGLEKPNSEALDFVEWIKGRAKIVGISEDVAFRAGELKKMLHIALPDCYVIAVAESVKATPLFKIVEKEMKPVLAKLKMLGVKFLEEYPA